MEVAARRRDGSEVHVALTLVPVEMEQSVEFNGFLEALELVGSGSGALARLQESHRSVVDWMAAAIAGHAKAAEDHAAGTIVAFRPLGALPERVQTEESDDGVPGVTTAALATFSERAAAELAGARADAAAAAERIVQLEATAERLGTELGDTRSGLDQVQVALEALLGDLGESRASDRDAGEALHEKLDKTQSTVSELEEALADRSNALRDTQSRVDAIEQALAADTRYDGEPELKTAREEAGEVARLGTELDELRTRLEAIGEAERKKPEPSSGAEALAAAVRAKGAAEAAEDHLAALAEAREAAEALTTRTEAAAVAAEEAAAELRRLAEERPTHGPFGNEIDWEGFADPRRPLIARPKPAEPPRDPRPGFDDAPNPMASIRLDGHFGELNPAFRELVGYSEEDFHAASWPPVTDRANLSTHRKQLQQLVSGEIESADVRTGYLHAQGLLVPVVGRLSLVCESDEPSHFLLEAETPAPTPSQV
jgi:PAS domain S-box-containing protein